MRLLWPLIAAFAFAACSTYRGQNRIQEDLVRFPGGVYQDKTWSETLVFKRTQFFIGATLYYDILAAKLDERSPFMNWLGETKSDALQCESFYVFMFYRNPRRAVPQRSILDQLERQGGDIVSVMDFRRNLREHYVSDEMHFLGHKARGVCFKSPRMAEKLEISLPGFNKTNLL